MLRVSDTKQASHSLPLASWQRRNRTVIFTTHCIGDAEANCDRVALMSRGRILDVGTPRELIQKYFAESLGEVMLEKGT